MIKERRSKSIDAWRERRRALEITKLQQIQDEMIRRRQPTRRTVIWLNKTVEQIFKSRLQFFKAEAACFSQR